MTELTEGVWTTDDDEEEKKDSFWDDWDEEKYQADLDDEEDFDTAPYWRPRVAADTGYVDRMWSSRWGGNYDQPSDAVVAHGIVNSFINAFARNGRYRVVFADSIQTAETNMVERLVKITPAPLLDPTLSIEEKGRILTGFAVHEIAHPRYGLDTWKAAAKAFPNSATAQVLSMALDDNRIEWAFAADYPGYSGVFDPTMKYVVDFMKKEHGDQYQATLDNPIGLMIAATRFTNDYDWTGYEAARDWWIDWNNRWAYEASPRRHLQGVREGLEAIVAQERVRRRLAKRATKAQAGGDGQPTPTEEDGTPSEDAPNDRPQTGSDGQPKTDVGGHPRRTPREESGLEQMLKRAQREVQKLDDKTLAEEAKEAEASIPYDMPIHANSEALKTVAENARSDAGGGGVDIDYEATRIQLEIDNEAEYEQAGRARVHVARSLNRLPGTRKREHNQHARWVGNNEAAARFIRDALMRSRTGHENVGRYMRHGRLDNHGLHRVAARDVRVFEKKTTESPGKYLVWLMLDHSASMGGGPDRNACEVAIAFANALKHVPTMRAEVWAWSDAFKQGMYGAGVARAWRTGQDTRDIAKIVDLKYGGTPDATIMEWAYRSIVRAVRPGETPVILFCSDGQGSVGKMVQNVEAARKLGVIVRSVALGWINADDQERIYGRNNFVPWQGTMTQTARPLARLVARIVSGLER